MCRVCRSSGTSLYCKFLVKLSVSAFEVLNDLVVFEVPDDLVVLVCEALSADFELEMLGFLIVQLEFFLPRIGIRHLLEFTLSNIICLIFGFFHT